MNETENTQPPIPCLAVKMHGETVWFDLETSSSVLIGSGGHCKIQLEGDGVRSLHCIVALRDGVVEVRDWNTGSTVVNGVAITDPVELQHGDCVRIFGHEIEVVLVASEDANLETPVDAIRADDSGTESTTGPHDQIQVEFAQPEVEFARSGDVEAEVESESVEDTQQTEVTSQVEFGPQLKDTCDANLETPVYGRQLETQSVNTVEEFQTAEPTSVDTGQSEVTLEGLVQSNVAETPVEDLVTVEQNPAVEQNPSDGFVYDVIANLNDETDQGQFDLDAPNFTSADVEELRAENARLKNELDQKAAEPVPVQDPPPAAEPEADVLSREQTLSMISRMQELVTALKGADQRNHELEEQLNNAKADQASSEPAEQSVPVELVMQMRDQVQALQSKLQSTLTEVNELREQAASVSGSSDDAADLEAAQKELADMRLEVSREREEVAREKAEVDDLKTELRARLETSCEVAVAEAPVSTGVTVGAETKPDEEAAISSQIASLIQRVSGDQ